MNNSRKYFVSFLLGVGLVVFLWLARVFYTQSYFYKFLFWNLFLAFIPFAISQYFLRKENLNKIQQWSLLALWLLFFPNAPYIVTDLIHLHHRNNIPIWYDATLLFTAALTGLWIGCVSLIQMESVWRRNFPRIKARYFVMSSLLLCGFGVYLGRMMRFNSWDILTDPGTLFKAVAYRIVFPWEYIGTWMASFLFAGVMWVAYMQVKNLTRDVSK